jgi:branched-chain amino acid transport system substrate-binding protein
MRPSAHARALATVLAPLIVAACSALVSHADSQCATDADCTKFPGTACVRGGCLPAADAGGAGPDGSDVCATTADCLRQHPEEDWICRRVDGTCVNLKSTDCTQVFGDYTADDALLLGALVPVFGPHATTGAALTGALRLAVSDFRTGIPSPSDAGATRPIAVVLCNESNGVKRPAQHLITDVQVPAILGTSDGATTLDLVTNVTQADGVLVMSPRATTTSLAALTTSGLVWRTCPPDTIESAALAAVTGAVITKNNLSSPHVALVYATDVTSLEMKERVLAAMGNDAGTPFTVDFGDPDEPVDAATDAYQRAVDGVIHQSPLPDVVILIGSTQAAENVLPAIEDQWPGVARPSYVVSSGVQTTELLAQAAKREDLPGRIVGTAPGANDTNHTSFLSHYRDSVTDSDAPEIFGTAQMYDAVYALAFAATPTVSPLGTDLAKSLRRLFGPSEAGPPTPITIGPAGIGAAFAAIAQGKTLALDGASAPLAFDTTEAVVSDVQVWCIAHGAGPSLVYQSTSLAYVASTSALTGTLTACP